MSFGKMARHFCTIKRLTKTIDSDSFATQTETAIVTNARCYREGRHGSERWANLSTFSDVTDLFRLRVDPSIHITTNDILYCGDDCFRIYSVEDVRGKGLYVEILATKVVPSVG
jgi:hypothetical protein